MFTNTKAVTEGGGATHVSSLVPAIQSDALVLVALIDPVVASSAHTCDGLRVSLESTHSATPTGSPADEGLLLM